MFKFDTYYFTRIKVLIVIILKKIWYVLVQLEILQILSIIGFFRSSPRKVHNQKQKNIFFFAQSVVAPTSGG